jgi:rhomboid family GlyGly-CTERM serine protease
MGVARPVNRVRRVLASLNGDGRAGFALLALCVLLLLAVFLGEPGRLALRYDRLALAQGQYWRLLSAHGVHLSLRHALLNILGLLLLWALFARDWSLRQWCLIVLSAILAIDAGLWFLDKTVLWYVGSSGVLYGVLAAGALAQVKRRQLFGWLVLGALAGKLLYEQRVGPLSISGIAVVVVDAHLYGVLGALAAGLPMRPRPL